MQGNKYIGYAVSQESGPPTDGDNFVRIFVIANPSENPNPNPNPNPSVVYVTFVQPTQCSRKKTAALFFCHNFGK